MKKYSGFTLTELLITLAIVGILMTVGVPSLRSFMQRNQLIASSNELLSAFHVARSEAIKLSTRVSICSSDNGTTCSLSNDWTKGWIVFVDSSGNLTNTGLPCTAIGQDCLLRVHSAITDSRLSVSGVDANNNVIKSFTFNARGVPKNIVGDAESGVFSVCSFDDSNSVINSRAMILSISGRVRISDDPVVITCPAAP